jgi:hypothetical protein
LKPRKTGDFVSWPKRYQIVEKMETTTKGDLTYTDTRLSPTSIYSRPCKKGGVQVSHRRYLTPGTANAQTQVGYIFRNTVWEWINI